MVKIYYKTPSSGLLYPSSQATITTTFQRLDLSPSSGQSKNIKFVKFEKYKIWKFFMF
jgi:hypothetical protein